MKLTRPSALPSLFVKASATAIAAAILMSGCVSRSAYDADMARLAAKLQQERVDNAATVRSLELRLKDRARSLSELTDRYMVLQHERAQYQLPELRKDMEVLLKDLDELKLVVTSNLKGSAGNEMLMKINDMQKRVNAVLAKESKAVVPVPDAATP